MALGGRSLSNATSSSVVRCLLRNSNISCVSVGNCTPSSYRARQMSLLYEDDKREIPRKFQQFSLSV